MDKKHTIAIYFLLTLIVVMQFTLLAKIETLQIDVENIGNYISRKVDKVTSEIYELQGIGD